MVRSAPRQPLFTNRLGFSVLGGARTQRFIHPTRTRSTLRTGAEARPTRTGNMPCRKENYIFLEQSVTVDSKEVDALVTKIGEALQLHNNNGTGHHHHLHGITAGAAAGGGGKQAVVLGPGAGAGIQRGHGCCLRLRSRGHHRGSSRASPYHIPGSSDQEWDQIRPWSKKRLAVEEDDPHRLLQELILSGNLIKEAVRRLQFSAGDCADNVSC